MLSMVWIDRHLSFVWLLESGSKTSLSTLLWFWGWLQFWRKYHRIHGSSALKIFSTAFAFIKTELFLEVIDITIVGIWGLYERYIQYFLYCSRLRATNAVKRIQILIALTENSYHLSIELLLSGNLSITETKRRLNDKKVKNFDFFQKSVKYWDYFHILLF